MRACPSVVLLARRSFSGVGYGGGRVFKSGMPVRLWRRKAGRGSGGLFCEAGAKWGWVSYTSVLQNTAIDGGGGGAERIALQSGACPA